MTQINFTKMQGLGNDFVILDYEEFIKADTEKSVLAKKLCDRNFGIGADGLIIINPDTQNTDIGWFFYNSDGSVAQMCGNGMRCFAKYVREQELVDSNEFSVETKAGIIIPKVNKDGTVTVNMNKPILEPDLIPVKSQNNLNTELVIKNKKFRINSVSMGNPHCVIFTENDTKEYALKYGPDIEKNSIFPEKTNVEFVKILSKKEIILDVWERGCGITLACGTGACASVVAGILNGYLDNKVKVNLPGGALSVEWEGSNSDTYKNVYMTGPAEYSFTGQINL